MQAHHSFGFVLVLLIALLFVEACSSQKSNDTPAASSGKRPANNVSNTNTSNNMPVQNENNDRPIPPTNNNDKPTNQAPPTLKPKANVGKDCFDPSKATKEMCQRLYEPVCGCDGITYANVCLAKNAGVLKWTSGECK